MQSIAERLPSADHRRGEVIAEPDDPVPRLFLITFGRVKLYRLTEGGHRLVLAILGPGDAFGQPVPAAPSASFAEAAEDCRVCIIAASDVDSIIADEPTLGISLVRALSARLHAVEDRLEDVALHPVPARIARLLMRLSGETGEVVEVTQQDLAEMAAACRETVSRALNQFRQESLVELKRRSIRITDPAGLQLIAHGRRE
ncbi:MAG: Crp/Fnr family transcriptional regulator [Dehalococcoidia bacterium]